MPTILFTDYLLRHLNYVLTRTYTQFQADAIRRGGVLFSGHNLKFTTKFPLPDHCSVVKYSNQISTPSGGENGMDIFNLQDLSEATTRALIAKDYTKSKIFFL